jgi:hypothetical protein
MDTTFPDTEKEIIGNRQWLINNCSIPAEDVVGWRSPYLVNNPTHRQALVKGGYKYDSTINEHWPDLRLTNPEPDTVSPNGASRLWPYTMDYGIPQKCSWTGGICKPEEKYPGFWEIPVWNIQTDSYPINAYALDPCDGSIPSAANKAPVPCDIFELLKENFDKAYGGNRAPVPMFFHSPWLSQPNTMKAVQKFIQYASSKKDTYFITMRQLMDWMKDPVSVDEMGAWLGCGTPGGKAAKGVVLAASAPVLPPVAEVPTTVVPSPVAPKPAPALTLVPVNEVVPATEVVEQLAGASKPAVSSATSQMTVSVILGIVSLFL